jgi:hypothetical protein
VYISTTAQKSTEPVTWESSIAHIKGGLVSWEDESPNPGGLLGQMWIATNHAQGSLHGQVYVLGSVRPNDSDDPLDVLFSRSTDGGQTWSNSVRINDDPNQTAWQWFGTMSVAPTGRIDVVWLDTRDSPDSSYLSALYYASSMDGGITWSANERLSDAFDPHIGWPGQAKIGDYFHMVSDSFGADLAWAGTFNGEQDVYYGRISSDLSATSDLPMASAHNQLFQNHPNPFQERTSIAYQVGRAGRVQVKIYNQMGVAVRQLVDQTQVEGKYAAQWDGKDDRGNTLPNGVYISEMRAEHGGVSSVRMLLLK